MQACYALLFLGEISTTSWVVWKETCVFSKCCC